MDECMLVKPDESMLGEVQAYRDEFLAAGSSMDGTGPLRRFERAAEWLAFTHLLENPETVPENWVASDQFVYVRASDRKIVGMIQFRREFNDFLRDFGGHIGYSVRPGERRKGYATRMLAECLAVVRDFGLPRALVTCEEGNEGSRRTILANGGVYERTVYCARDDVTLERYWIPT
jgi:predicted acetyltransferase